MKGKIYCLRDPFTLEIKYIGFTRVTLESRFSQHKHEALKKNTLSHCYNWFRKCNQMGKLPIIELIEDNISILNWEEKESYWIKQFDNLTNQRPGGTGIHLNTNNKGRLRSINAKRLSIIQLSLDGNYIKTWDSIIEAEKAISNKYTGNIYRAVKNSSTAFNSLWIKSSEYISDKNYLFSGKQWKPIFLYCLYTHKLIKQYDKSTKLATEFSVNCSVITQALIGNLVFKNFYFIRNNLDVTNPPKSKPIYCINNRYYNNFNELYRLENLPYSLGFQKKIKQQYLVTKITEDIVRTLRETVR